MSAQPRSWPMTLAERELTAILLGQRAQIEAKLNAIWQDRAEREKVDPKTLIEIRGGAWVEAKGG